MKGVGSDDAVTGALGAKRPGVWELACAGKRLCPDCVGPCVLIMFVESGFIWEACVSGGTFAPKILSRRLGGAESTGRLNASWGAD